MFEHINIDLVEGSQGKVEEVVAGWRTCFLGAHLVEPRPFLQWFAKDVTRMIFVRLFSELSLTRHLREQSSPSVPGAIEQSQRLTQLVKKVLSLYSTHAQHNEKGWICKDIEVKLGQTID